MSEDNRNIWLVAPLTWYGLVVAGTVLWAVLGGPNRVNSSYWLHYVIWQSAIVAAVMLGANAWYRDRRILGITLGGGLTLVAAAFEMLALPLDLYSASEWVRMARESGLFTLW